MIITLAGSAVTYVPNDTQLGGLSLEFAAFDGEIGTGQLPMPDSAAALDIDTGRQARVDEGTALLTDGFIIDHDRTRGPEPAGTAREYSYSVVDANALMDGFRVSRARPAESDYTRLMAFAANDGPDWDTTWVLNSSTVALPAKTYFSDGGWSELITDLVEFTGKTIFLHDKANGSGRCLHWHVLTTGHTCGLQISDVFAAVNGTTVYAPQNPQRQRTSVDLVNDVRGDDADGRHSFLTDAASKTAHDADGLRHEAQIEFDTTTQHDLDLKTAAFLASQKGDRDTYTCAIGPLDATALTLIRVGDVITVTSSVMGLTASPQRIAHMTLTVYPAGSPAPGLWLAQLEMGAPIRRKARVKGKTPPAALPPPLPPIIVIGDPIPHYDPACESELAWYEDSTSGTGVFDSVGNVATFSLIGGTGLVQAGMVGNPWVITDPTWSVAFHVRMVSDFDPNGVSIGQIMTVGFLGVGGTYGFQASVNGAGGTPGDGTAFLALMVGDERIETRIPYVQDLLFTFTWTGAGGMVSVNGKFLSATATGTPTFPLALLSYPSGTFYVSPVIITVTADLVNFCTFTSVPPPGPNQFVDEVVGTGDGTTVLYQTSHPYLPGSLSTFANGLHEYDFTETDPTTGAYTFASPPLTGEEVRAHYVATGAAAADPPPVDPGDEAPGAIQALVDAAAPGATVNVPDGVYRETVTIDKALTLVGSGTDTCIIDGRDTTGGVPVREQWLIIDADDVNVSGFQMRYAAGTNAAGSVENTPGVERFVLDGCDIHHSYVLVNLTSSVDSVISDCDIHDAAHLGVRISQTTTRGSGNQLLNSRLYHNNRTGEPDPGADGGNLKATGQDDLVLDGNEASDSDKGLWLDVDCQNAVISDNKVYYNDTCGIMDETSIGTEISGNACWNNGFGPYGNWGWGAGILISSSQAANVHDNVCAWNRTGISVVNQDRVDNPGVTDNSLHDNVVVETQPSAGNDRYGMFWGQDFAGTMYDVGDNNTGSNNEFWYPAAENAYARFIWDGYRTLAEFAATAGGAGSTYISDAAKDAALTAAGIPLGP